MTIRLQNRVSESRLTLPSVSFYAILVWIAGGLTDGQMWIQFACFATSTYLMVELNNSNALIRIYSRMVSCAFLALSCAAGFLFHSMGGAVTELCVIGSYTMLFKSYQDRQSAGWTFYAFLCIGLGSMFQVAVLYYVPVIWLLMALYIRSMSWRTLAASAIGLCAPYWFAGAWLVYDGGTDYMTAHFTQLAQFRQPFDHTALSAHQAVTLLFIIAISITGIVHYYRQSYNDKIRIRMFYYCFIMMDLVSVALVLLQPQHYDLLMRMIIINTSPLIAHFIALTRTRATNAAFYTIAAATLLLTAYNLWMPSTIF